MWDSTSDVAALSRKPDQVSQNHFTEQHSKFDSKKKWIIHYRDCSRGFFTPKPNTRVTYCMLTMISLNVVWLISYSKTHLAQALVYPYSTTLQSALSSGYFGRVVHVVQQAINRLYM